MVNIVLSSGGYDSTVLLKYCKKLWKGNEPYYVYHCCLWKDKKVEYYLYHCCLIDDTVKSENSDFEIINEAETRLFIENNNEPIINSKLHLLNASVLPIFAYRNIRYPFACPFPFLLSLS